MKIYIFFILLVFSCKIFAATYYSDAAGGDPNNVNLWWSNANGTGSHPADFTSSADVFYLKAGHNYTTTNAWNISGTLQVYGNLTIQTANSIKILTIFSGGIVTGSAQTTITAAASGGQFTINDGGKYIFNHATASNATTLFAGTESFGTSSTIEFQDFQTTSDGFSLLRNASASDFGNVIWNIQAGNTAFTMYPSNPGTDNICLGDFTVSKTGASGSLKCIRGGTGGTLTIGGDLIISDGTFDLFPAGSSSTLNFNVTGNVTISGTGILELSSGSTTSTTNFNLSGNFSQTGGTFRTTSSSGTTTMYFSGSSTQTYTYSSGTFTTTNTKLNVKSGAIVVLASNLAISNTLTVASGGSLELPSPYYVSGSGTTTISTGATLITGNKDGITTTASEGCIQTTSRSYAAGVSLTYNGTVPQDIGDGFASVANLTLNNSTGVTFSQNLSIANGGVLTLTTGYHDLNGYTLSMGTTTAATNSMVYTAGGIYDKTNSGGAIKKYIPTGATVTYNSGNYYGLFPFAKSAGQIQLVKLTTSGTVTGGYITISPVFGYDEGVSCNVADGANTIYRVQTGTYYTITANTITGGTAITMQYDCGVYLDAAQATASALCLATYTSSVVSTVGTHVANAGSETAPQVSRNTIGNMSSLTAGMVCVLGSHDADNSLALSCNIGGTKTVGPTGDYATLTAALTAISDQGMNTSLILELQAAYTSTSETMPLTIDPFNCMGSSNTLIIRPEAGATGLTISDPKAKNIVFEFNKGDYTTIDGRPGSSGSTSQLTITNTKTTKATISFKNDANYNSLKYLVIEGAQSGVSSGTIEFNGTTQASGNMYDTISYCTIKNESTSTHGNAIYSVGQSAAKTNASNFLIGNKFVDCLSGGVFLDVQNDAWTISDNHFYQTASITPTASMYGIHVVNTGSGYTISGNYIGGQAISCGGSSYTLNSSANHFYPIYLSVGSTSATSIQGNIIQNITLTNTDGSSTGAGIFTGIYVSGAGVLNVGNVSGNKIGDSTVTATNISITSSVSGALIQGMYISASGTTTLSNNIIGNFATSNVSTKGYTFYGINNLGTGTTTFNSNKIGSYNTASAIQIGGASTGTGVCKFYGIYNSSTGDPTFSSNVIGNCSVYGTGASLIYGIYNTSATTLVSISSNTILKLGNLYVTGTNTSAYCVGIYQSANIATSIVSNVIKSFTVNNGFFRGIYLVNTSGTNTLTSNIIGSSTLGDIAISSGSSCSTFSTNVTANHGGIVISSTSVNSTLTSNTIYGITCSGTISYQLGGIVIGAGTTPIVSLSSNTIEKIGVSNTGAYTSAVYGIYYGSTNSTSITHKKNIVRNLFSANTSNPNIYGAYAVSYNSNWINNFISIKNTDGTTSYTNSLQLYGLYLTNTAASSKTTNVYYNTIEIGGSQAAGTNLSYTMYQNCNQSSTLVYYNNIFQNARTGSTGNQYCYYASSTTPTSTHSYNYYVAPSLTTFAYVAGVKTSAAFLVAADDYGNTTSTGTVTALVIETDASISDVSPLLNGVDLHLTTDCTDDINGTVGMRASASTLVHKGCYEGAVVIYYSADATANTDANTLTNWNSKTDATGVAPSDFTTSGAIFIIQSGHKYQLTSSLTGSAAGYIQVLDGGALDLNAQTLSTWGSIKMNGTGVSSSGALLNSSSTASSCSIPITLESASTIVSSGTGGLTLTGDIDNGGFDITCDGANAVSITTGVISGTGGLIKEGAGTLTLSGINTYTGVTTINDGTLSVSTIGDGGVAGNLGQATNVLTNLVLGGGTLKYTGSTASSDRAFSLTAGTTSYINVIANTLTLSGSSGNATNGSLTKLGNGTLVLSGSNTYTGTTTISAGTLQLGATGDGTNTPLGTTGGGTVVSSGGCLDLAGYTLGTAEAITISGAGVSSSGAIMNSGGSCTYSGLVTLGANASILGGSGTIALSNVGTISGATYILTLGGAQGGSIASIIGTTSGGITKQDAGTWTLTGANTFTGAVAVNAGVLNLQNNTAAGTTAGGVTVASGAALELQGGITVGAEALSLNNDGVSSAGSLRNISGSNTWGGAITLSTNAVRINSDAGTLTLSSTITNGAIDLTIGGAGDIVASGVIGNGAGALTKDGAGQLTLGATNTYSGITTLTAGTLLLGAAQTSLTNNIVLTAGTLNAAGYAITSSGSWTNNGATFTHGNNTVTLTGTGKTIGGSSSSTFYNLTLSGASTYTLGASQTVDNTFTFAGGSILTLSTYDLTIGSSGVFSGYDASNFVVTNSTGKVTQNGIQTGSAAGKQIFPVGYTSTSYTPALVNNTGTSDNFSIYIGNNRLANGTSGAASTSTVVDRTWFIEEAVAGGSTVDLTLQWNTAEELSFDRTACAIGHYTGGAWDVGSLGAAAGSNPWTISRSGLTSFSPFDVEEGAALPIDLVKFTAKQEGSKVRLDWTTASEEDNDYFTLERSKDGVEFQELFRKDGTGVSTTFLYYFGYDNAPRVGVNYYRLKQTDFDGKYEYSQIESVDFKVQENQMSLKVYPNPMIDNSINLEFYATESANYEVMLYDQLGKVIASETIQVQKGKNIKQFTVENLIHGIYFLELIDSEKASLVKRKVEY